MKDNNVKWELEQVIQVDCTLLDYLFSFSLVSCSGLAAGAAAHLPSQAWPV